MSTIIIIEVANVTSDEAINRVTGNWGTQRGVQRSARDLKQRCKRGQETSPALAWPFMFKFLTLLLDHPDHIHPFAKRIKSGEIHCCPAPAWERSLTLWCLAPLTNRDAGASQGCGTTQERCNDTKKAQRARREPGGQNHRSGAPALDRAFDAPVSCTAGKPGRGSVPGMRYNAGAL